LLVVSQTGSAAAVQSVLSVHSSQIPVPVSHATLPSLRPTQLVSDVHPPHMLLVVLHSGSSAVGHVVLSVHSTQRCVVTLHAGVAPLQSEGMSQPTMASFIGFGMAMHVWPMPPTVPFTSQNGVAPLQSLLDLQ
jgi:hypothetical protein